MLNHGPECWPVKTSGNNRDFTTPSIYTNCFDVERNNLSITSWTMPAIGSVTPNEDGSFNYSPSSTHSATIYIDTFFVVVTDGCGGYYRTSIEVQVGGVSRVLQATIASSLYTDWAAIQLSGGADIENNSGYKVPRLMDWNSDGLVDLLIGASGYIWVHLNVGSSSTPVFSGGERLTSSSEKGVPEFIYSGDR